MAARFSMGSVSRNAARFSIRANSDKVKGEFQKIKLTLPKPSSRTTTEKYFALDVAP